MNSDQAGLAEAGKQRSPAAIQCQQVVKAYGKGKGRCRAVDAVDMDVPQGTM
jgi:hypothetical protein